MGLWKDIYDILKTQPEVQKMVEEAMLSFMKGKLFKKAAPTRQERITHLKQFIPQVVHDDFSKKFTDLLHFFGVLLATIVESTYASTRGCIVSKLFLPDYVVYFPVISEELSLRKLIAKSNKAAMRALVRKDGNYYAFYAVKPKNNKPTNLQQLREKLTTIARENPINGEESTFVDWLNENDYETISLGGIGQHPNTQAFRFVPTENIPRSDKGALFLDFTDQSIKKSIANDLLEILDFNRV